MKRILKPKRKLRRTRERGYPRGKGLRGAEPATAPKPQSANTAPGDNRHSTDAGTALGKQATAPTPLPDQLQLVNDGRPRGEQLANSALSTVALNALIAVNAVHPYMAKANRAEAGMTAFTKIMGDKVARVAAGDMSGIEATMTAQIISMDAICAGLMTKAQANFAAGYLDAGERYMRLAFKAQSQCRATAETLGELKNPRPVFAKQFNLANGNQQINQTEGPQQVNNGAASQTPRAPGKPLITNKLLESEE